MTDQNLQADLTTLMQQASATADTYFWRALETGKKAAPQFPADHMDWALKLAAIAAQDFHSAAMGVAAQKLCVAYARGLD